MVEWFHGQAPDLIHAKTKDGVTAVIAACLSGETAVLKFLVGENAELNSSTAFDAVEGVTALMLASERGHLQNVQILASEGADVSAVTSDNNTALSLAEAFGHEDVTQFLRAHSK